MEKDLIIIDPVFLPGLLPLKSMDFQTPGFINIFAIDDRKSPLAKVVTVSGMLGIFELPENIEEILDFLDPEDSDGQLIANKSFDKENKEVAVTAPFPLAYWDIFDPFELINQQGGWAIKEEDDEGYFLKLEK